MNDLFLFLSQIFTQIQNDSKLPVTHNDSESISITSLLIVEIKLLFITNGIFTLKA